VRIYFSLFRGSRLRLTAAVALAVGQMLVLLPIPLFIKLAFDRAIPGGDVSVLVLIGVAEIALQTTSALLAIRARALTLGVVKQIVFGLRRDLMARQYALPRAVYVARDAGRVHDLIVHDTERFDVLANALLFFVLPTVVLVTGVAGLLLWLSPVLTAVTVALLPAAIVMSHYLRARLRRATRRFHGTFEAFSRRVWVGLESTDLTNVHAAAAQELERQSRTMEELRRDSLAMAWLQSTVNTAHSTAAVMMGGLILIVGGVLLSRGSLTLGELVSFYAALALLRTSSYQAVAALPQLVEGREAAERIVAALEANPPAEYTGTRPLALSGRVTLDAVSFRYGERPVLRDVNLQLEPGTVVGLSGESGAGKTTVAMILLGLHRPIAGRVLFDGVPLEELDVAHVRRQIGMMPQDPLILPLSVAENIAFGHALDVIGIQRVREAAALAGADRFIASLPHGFETTLDSRGVRLSGGQRQRIALARALVAEPRLVILDEPTNHLGTATVLRTLEQIARWPAAPAVLIVSHDPALLGRLPRVVVLAHGAVRDALEPVAR
jgi:ABC-type bacteriocin/lantibiotic exporter with double-glycine peptidase domain